MNTINYVIACLSNITSGNAHKKNAQGKKNTIEKDKIKTRLSQKPDVCPKCMLKVAVKTKVHV
jgi:hypothetical protein